MKLLALIGLLVVAVSGRPEGRIVGGQLGNIKDFPYLVSLRTVNVLQCGASIIAKRWALTAAHCVYNKEAEDVSFQAGSTLFSSGGIIVQADKIYLHPDFDYATAEYDVALISTKTDFVGKNISPVALPEIDASEIVGKYITVAGWGKISERGPVSNILKYTKLKVLKQEKCMDFHETSVFSDEMFCAAEPKTDSCQGDSGGPAVIDKVQVGIVSWGIGCARISYPGVFTRVSDPQVRKWIKSVANV